MKNTLRLYIKMSLLFATLLSCFFTVLVGILFLGYFLVWLMTTYMSFAMDNKYIISLIVFIIQIGIYIRLFRWFDELANHRIKDYFLRMEELLKSKPMSNINEAYAAPGLTVKEFADHLKKETGKSWEEICHLLLALQDKDLMVQNKMVDVTVESIIPRPVQLITACVKQLNWKFYVDLENPSTEVDGFIIGTEVFMRKFIKQ